MSKFEERTEKRVDKIDETVEKHGTRLTKVEMILYIVVRIAIAASAIATLIIAYKSIP